MLAIGIALIAIAAASFTWAFAIGLRASRADFPERVRLTRRMRLPLLVATITAFTGAGFLGEGLEPSQRPPHACREGRRPA